MKTLLWLDDIRDPNETKWKEFFPIEPDKVIWVKSFNEFTHYINQNGLPTAICFDHDLGMPVAIKARERGMSKRKSRELKQQEKSGMDCVKWLVEYCLDTDSKLPIWNIQSANPVGTENMKSLLTNFSKHN